MASAAFLRMCPEARARTAIPTTTSTDPAMMAVQSGRANQRYAAAKAKPSGTRERVATRAQLGIATPQQMARRGNDFFCRDLKQAGFGCAMMRERRLAFRMAQRDGPGPKRPGAGRIRRTVKSDNGYAQCRGQMQRAGIAPDKDAGAAR